MDKTYLLNPGSMTGAFTPLRTEVYPSFLIIEFKSTSTIIYTYQLIDNEVKLG